MKLRIAFALPAVLSASLLLAACGDNPTAPTASQTTDAAAEAEEASAEAAAAEAAAAEAAAAEAAAAEAAAAEAAAAEAAAAEAAAAEAAAAEAAAAEAAAAEAAAEEAAAAEAAEAVEPVEPKLPATGLQPDTLAAVRASVPVLPYLGVWAVDAAACGTVDQAGASDYAVITSISIREGQTRTFVSPAQLVDGEATLTGVDSTFAIAMPTPDALTLNGTAMVRCVE